MFSGCSYRSYGTVGICWSFQMKVWTNHYTKESDDPQLFDDPSNSMIPSFFYDPQLFDDHLEVWTLIIQKFTVIPPSLISFLEKKVLPALVLASYIVYFAVACNFYFDN